MVLGALSGHRSLCGVELGVPFDAGLDVGHVYSLGWWDEGEGDRCM